MVRAVARRAAFFPHDTEAVWTLADERSVYVVEHPEGAGNSVVTFFVDDLDAEVAAIAARGLAPDEPRRTTTACARSSIRDPDGNELGFAGAPPRRRFIGQVPRGRRGGGRAAAQGTC